MATRTPFDPERRAPKLAPLGAALAIVGGAVGGWVGVPLALAGLALMFFACVSRADGFLLLGPVGKSELYRAARLGRPQLWRVVYAVAAGLVVLFNFTSWVPADQLFGGARIGSKRLESINTAIAQWFAILLFLYTCVLTVQVLAGAVAEEREKKRWDVLLTTDLRGREILLGKLFGRMPVLLDPLLAALPVLAILPLFGGVPPWLAGVTVLCCVSVMLGLGAVALFCSTFAATRGAATGSTAFLAFVYMVVAGALAFVYGIPNVADFPRTRWANFPVTVGDVVYPLVTGSPTTGLVILAQPGADIEAEAPRMAWHFALFQFAVFALFGFTAIRRLPRAAVWTGGPQTLTGTERVKVVAKVAVARDRKPSDPVPVPKPEKEAVNRLPVGDWSLTWWERYGWLNKGQMNFVRKIFGRLPFIAGAAFVLYFGLRVMEWVRPSEERAVRHVADLTVVPVFLIGLAFLIAPGFRAARCVAKERAADTMDGLLLMPLSREEILFQKWLGVVLCDWPGFAPLLAILGIAAVCGHVPVLAVVAFAVGVPVGVMTLAALGLYCSTVSATPGRAVFRFLMLVAAFAFVVGTLGAGYGQTNERAAIAAMLPPVAFVSVMGEYEMAGRPPVKGRERNLGAVVVGWCAGVAAYGAAAYAAWWLACRRFERERRE